MQDEDAGYLRTSTIGGCRTISRQELYALVWQTPMSRLAKSFGLSDVGLRKICVKHDIPTPKPGYWAKLMQKRPRGSVDGRRSSSVAGENRHSVSEDSCATIWP